MKANVKKLHQDAKLPTYATDGSGCFDIYALIEEGKTVDISKGYPHTFLTGLAFEIPKDWTLFVFSRSGHGRKFDIRLANCVGVIDSDYRGELQIVLTSDNCHDVLKKFSHGEAIAQGCLIYTPKVDFIEVNELSETERGAGGFGSTGG